MTEQPNLKRKAAAGIFWKLMENGGTQGILFLVTVILARLIEPAEYGVLSITVIFVTIAGVLVQRGFSLSLVQKKDVDDTDLSSVLYLSVLVAGLMVLALWFAAPAIARFYDVPEVTRVLRAISFILVAGAVSSVQSAIIMRELAFRKRFFVSLIAVILSGTAGIVMAYRGYGVWALVTQQLIDNFTMCIGLTIATRWLPKALFSFQRLGRLFSFGWKLLASSLIETVYSELSGMIIGKRYTASMLAYYDKGRKFPQLIGTNVTGAIQGAMFPTFSIAQEDPNRLLTMVRRSVSASAFLIFPLMAGLAAVAEPMVRIVLLPKWLPAVPFLRVFCVTFAMYPVDATVLQAINAIGRSDVYLKLEIAKKVCGLLLLAAAVFLLDTPVALSWALAAVAVLSVAFNAIPAKRLLGYRYRDQLKDLLPSLALSVIMGIGVYLLAGLGLSDWATLSVQVAAGVMVYVSVAAALKLDSFTFLWRSIQEFRRGKQGESK